MRTDCIDMETDLLQLARQHGDRLLEKMKGGIAPAKAPAHPALLHWNNPENVESGRSGDVLFLLELYRQTGEERYLHAVNGAVQDLLDYCEAHPTYNYSLYTGRGGVIWMLMQLHAITGEDRLLADCLKLAKPAAQEYLHSRYTSDYLYNGRAGTLLLLLHLYLLTKEEFLLSYIGQFVQKILLNAGYDPRGISWRNGEEMDLRPSCGFALGTAGIRYALHQLSLCCADPALAFVLRGIDGFTDACWMEDAGNWGNASREILSRETLEAYRKEFAAGNPALLTPTEDFSWANGAAGILFALPAGPEGMEERLAAAAENMTSFRLYDGLAGLGLYQLQCGNTTSLNGIIAAVASALQEAKEEEDGGLLHGSTGQAYFLLKANAPAARENILFPFHTGRQEDIGLNASVGFPWLRKQLLIKTYPRTVFLLEKAAPAAFAAYLQQPATEGPSTEREKFAAFAADAAALKLAIPQHERIRDAYALEKAKCAFLEAETKPRLQTYLEELDFTDGIIQVLNKPDAWLLQQTLSISPKLKMVHTQWDWSSPDNFEPMSNPTTLEKYEKNLSSAPRRYEYIFQVSGRQEIMETYCDMSFQMVLHRFMEPKTLAQGIAEIRQYVHALPEKALVGLLHAVGAGKSSTPAEFVSQLDNMILDHVRPLIHRNILKLN